MYIDRRKVRQEIKAWKLQSGLGNLRKVQFKINNTTGTVQIFASRPGYLIGRGGKLYEEYKNKMKILGVSNIEIVEVEDMLI